MARINLGFDYEQKRKCIHDALTAYGDVDRIFVFYGGKAQPPFNFGGIETIYTPWSETEMYRTFYPLLGQPYKGQDIPAITDKSLLIVDEMLVDRHRGCLKQNCTMHFMRVSKRRLIFNWLPFIEDADDFMILLDFAYPDKYKKQKFHPDLLGEIDVEGVEHLPRLQAFEIQTSEKQKEQYEEKKEELFDNIGQKDPNTIPRNLVLSLGSIKKEAMRPGEIYVTRNRRIKGAITYKDTGHKKVYLLDPAYSRKDLIGFMHRSGTEELIYMKTDLSVDAVYWNDLNEWHDRLEEFYGTADLH